MNVTESFLLILRNDFVQDNYVKLVIKSIKTDNYEAANVLQNHFEWLLDDLPLRSGDNFEHCIVKQWVADCLDKVDWDYIVSEYRKILAEG